MAGSGAGFGGQSQIINGQSYVMYSPQWYDAMHAEAQRQATAQGTASGSALAAASKAAGVPIGSSATSSSSSTGSATGSGSGAYSPPATIAPPSMQGLSSAAAAAPGGTGGSSGGSGYAHLAHVDTSAADKASFNTAKDQVGLESSGALTGLRSALAGRNLLGSGLEERGTAAAATSAAGQLGEVSRTQAVNRADEAEKEAATNYTGDITQRGQDFQHEEAANSLAGSMSVAGYNGSITQRGQDISAANAQRALDLEQAQLASQQRSTALAGLEAALKVSAPTGGAMY